MRPTIAISILAAAALAGCGAGDAAPDSSQLAQYVGSGSASSARALPGASGGASAPKCFTAADVKSAMGVEMVDLTGGMRKYGTFWNCGYVPTDTVTYRGASVQLTVAPAAEADQRFEDLKIGLRIPKGPTAEPDVIQVGDRAMAYGTPSFAVAAAVAGDRMYIVEAMYGTGRVFSDKKDGTIELLRKMVGS